MSQPISVNTPVRFRDPLPEAVDVVIIGGGIIGVFSALYLARAGQTVLVCEKGRIAGEQSSRNWGWIRQQGRDAAELPIMMRALELWHEANGETGGACGVRTGGTVYLAKTDAERASHETWVKLAAEHGLHSACLSDREIAEQFGGAAKPGWVGAVRTSSDARGEPWQAVPAVASLAREAGAQLREDCAVRALDLSAGNIIGVVTEDGPVKCGQVILAAGAWSSLFARRHGITIPQLAVHGTVACTAPLPQFFNGNASDEKLAFRRREDGGYTIALTDRNTYFLGPDGFRHVRRYLPLIRSSWRSLVPRPAQPSGFPDAWNTARAWAEDETTPFERVRVLDPKPAAADVRRLTTRFADRFPELGAPQIKNAWAGMIDAMPDVVPIVDRMPDMNGLIIATGMSGHGFGIGPAFAEILTRMVLGQPPGFDMARFRIGRFSDGSKLEIGPGF